MEYNSHRESAKNAKKHLWNHGRVDIGQTKPDA